MAINLKKTTKGVIAFFVAFVWITAIYATPSFDCKKAVTDVERAICDNESIALMDLTLDYIYKICLKTSLTPLEVKKSQLQWMSTRPSNVEKLEEAYLSRIQGLLSNQLFFENIVKTFFKQYDASIENWTHKNTLYDGMDNDLICSIMTCILDSYLKKQEKKVSFESEGFLVRQSSSLFKLQSDKYLFFYCHSMGAYNGEYTAWIISLKDSKFSASQLKIPIYDLKTNTIKFEDVLSGFTVFNEKDQTILIHYKGVGYGGLSTDRFLYVAGNQLMLSKQSATKDNYDQAYELKGTDEDWLIEYENKK